MFLATSAIHREFKLKMTPDEVIRKAVEGVKRARDRVEDIEFSPEDAARTELDFLAEVVEKAVEPGATTLNIPDTVGYAVPSHYASIIRHLKQMGIGILITDHNVRETLRITDRAYIINNGGILRTGSPADLSADPQVRKIYLGDHFQL